MSRKPSPTSSNKSPGPSHNLVMTPARKVSAVGGKAPQKKRKADRRVVRTRNVLGDALVALMHEKPFDEITVQHVLDRAGVGRSTFYTHYRDKNDLFMSDAADFFEYMSTLLSRNKEDSTRVAPVREMFAHLIEMRDFLAAVRASGRIHDVTELGQGHFARGIEGRLAGMSRTRAMAPAARTAVSHALAGAMLSLLNWWIDHGMAESPAQMDDVFHRIVWSGVSVPSATQT
jgi:AcrR family transcriptional regulator